jgi:hypothetical protein
MNSKAIKIFSILLPVLLFLNACEKDVEYKGLTGQLIGYVRLYDKSDNPIRDYSGIKVSAEGSHPQIEALTDKNGQFILDDLKSGTYNIVYDKEGYCQHKIASVQFVGGNRPTGIYPVSLYKESDVEIDSVSVESYWWYHSYKYLVSAKLTGITEEDNYTHLVYYLNNNPDVSSENYMDVGFEYVSSSSNDIRFENQVDTLKYPVGSEVYMVMYHAKDRYNYYIDMKTGLEIYTSINKDKPSDVVSFTVSRDFPDWYY